MKSLVLGIMSMSLLTTVCYAETVKAAPAPPLAVIEPQDLQELNSILTDQVPQRWATPFVQWVSRLIERQKAAAAESAAKK